ncbi:cell envelope integrity protein TolA [Paraglaciecola aquimarina]|uniref:Cell envelope integrity protein TolA n=1 Tax=Paraglaciecola aquimarina TaxID=1235557 RepID=A0ABU3T1B3_9ALTE|nr:cell envelope integrity protein TolA [Paraglaciecola aquimarina]MDU0356065.1 cell envelope integrity protein TolA [Paraglaciecola aquimarina]
MSKFSTTLVISFSLHLLAIIVLIVSGKLSNAKPTPEYSNPQPIIEAVVIDRSAYEAQVKKVEDEKRQKRLNEERRVKELERKAAEAEAQKRKAEQQIRDKKKAEQAAAVAREKQKVAKAKAQKLEAERKRKELEKKKKEELAKKAKQKREREEKARKEAERKKREAEEKAKQDAALQEQLQAEQAARQQRRNKQVLTEVQKYQSLIKQTIQRNLIVDDAMKGKSCRLNIRLASNGLVTQVKELSGNAILCRAARAAVFKADTLPVSKEPDVYQKLRDINLTVEPEL